MSLLGIYNIGESALVASQAALAVTSNNMANANTPGFDARPLLSTLRTLSRPA